VDKNISSFSSKKIHDGDFVASLLIPLFAKNSRLGYFFYTNNLRIKFAKANLGREFESLRRE
jgi:hypothetical protein